MARIILLSSSFSSALSLPSVSLFPNLINLFSSFKLFINISLFFNASSSSQTRSSRSPTSRRRRCTSSANCLTLNSMPLTDVSKSNIFQPVCYTIKSAAKIHNFSQPHKKTFCSGQTDVDKTQTATPAEQPTTATLPTGRLSILSLSTLPRPRCPSPSPPPVTYIVCDGMTKVRWHPRIGSDVAPGSLRPSPDQPRTNYGPTTEQPRRGQGGTTLPDRNAQTTTRKLKDSKIQPTGKVPHRHRGVRNGKTDRQGDRKGSGRRNDPFGSHRKGVYTSRTTCHTGAGRRLTGNKFFEQ